MNRLKNSPGEHCSHPFRYLQAWQRQDTATSSPFRMPQMYRPGPFGTTW